MPTRAQTIATRVSLYRTTPKQEKQIEREAIKLVKAEYRRRRAARTQARRRGEQPPENEPLTRFAVQARHEIRARMRAAARVASPPAAATPAAVPQAPAAAPAPAPPPPEGETPEQAHARRANTHGTTVSQERRIDRIAQQKSQRELLRRREARQLARYHGAASPKFVPIKDYEQRVRAMERARLRSR